MPYLKPFTLKDKYWHPIEREIQRLFNSLLYARLAAIVTQKPAEELTNSISFLLDAVRAGTVWYEGGLFKGQFNSHISKELRGLGATYNIKSQTWGLPHDLLPTDVKFAQANADDRISKMREEMLHTLDNIRSGAITEQTQTQDHYEKTVEELQQHFQTAVQAVTIPTQLTPDQRDIISQQWGTNLDLYIRNWVDENVIKLRQQVQSHALNGGRAEGLVKLLQENYGQSKAKAKFLARQETSLLMSKFQETKMREVGVVSYKWSTSHDERVRHDHALLDGKIFRFDDPPITNRKTAAKNNPGEDFNCRCIAVPWFD